MLEESSRREARQVVSAASSRRAANDMHWGNIVAILLPVPVPVFWFGVPIVFSITRVAHCTS